MAACGIQQSIMCVYLIQTRFAAAIIRFCRAHLLQVANVLVLDENPEGLEGPWVTYARMWTLRTNKALTGAYWLARSLAPCCTDSPAYRRCNPTVCLFCFLCRGGSSLQQSKSPMVYAWHSYWLKIKGLAAFISRTAAAGPAPNMTNMCHCGTLLPCCLLIVCQLQALTWVLPA